MMLRIPWTVEQSSQYPGLYSVYDCDGNVVAKLKVFEVTNLIAAAPDLLEALEAVEWGRGIAGIRYCLWCSRPYPDHAPDCQRETALALARGEEAQ